jgi:hypothetical protein
LPYQLHISTRRTRANQPLIRPKKKEPKNRTMVSIWTWTFPFSCLTRASRHGSTTDQSVRDVFTFNLIWYSPIDNMLACKCICKYMIYVWERGTHLMQMRQTHVFFW